MRAGPAWAAGLAASALLHVAAAIAVVPAYAPKPPPSQPPPETRLNMETIQAPRQDAVAQAPDSAPASEGQAQGTSVGAGAVPRSDARPVATTAERQAALPPVATAAQAATTSGTALAEATPSAGRLTAANPAAQALSPAAPQAGQLAEAPPPQSQPVAPTQADITPLAAANPQAQTATVAAPPADSLAASAPSVDTASAAAPEAERLSAAAPSAEAIPAAQPAPDLLTAAVPEPETARPSTPPAAILTAAKPAATGAAASPPVIAPAAVIAPDTTASAALSLSAQGAPPVAPSPANLPAASATGEQTAALAATGARLPQARPDASTAEQATPPATSAKAALAWQFGDRVVTDPQALATIQAFMEPAALDNAEGVKDDLSSVLTGVDCARLSATFIPETGTLEMRGHIPDPELQGPILAALQAQVGEGIPVTANLLHLPKPQCGALSGIASAGLPQSTDQFTNERLVGASAHAREYGYSEGQRLQFDLTAPDYDAYVYVDYFNADGEVIHLVPNDTIALERHAAKSVFGVGEDRPGQPGLLITIGPPFGQEIAVAFAASHPLYEGLRPIVEPAAPYLEELQAMVAEARARHEDFKGEWVYFFITTSPATQ